MRMALKRGVPLLCACVALAACEDGPDPVYNSSNDDLNVRNGYGPTDPWVQGGETSWESSAGTGDSVERARFCDQQQIDAIIQEMVTKALVPDQSVGGIPFWTPGGSPMPADDLVGLPEHGKFCDPTAVYSNAFVWGPNFEIIVFINQDTRLVEAIQVNQAYLGNLTGYVTMHGEQVELALNLREEVRIGERRLIDYASSAAQGEKPNSWLNHGSVTAIYGMLRETYFGGDPLPTDFDCVASKQCDIIYTAEDEAVAQETLLSFTETGTVLVFSPDGKLTHVVLSPVRMAPFESEALISFAAAPATTFSPQFASQFRTDCDLDLASGVTWAQFRDRCITTGEEGSERILGRFNYSVATQRDAVDVEFNGVTLGFLRTDTTASSVLWDGERPADGDTLYSMQITRSLNAPVQQFRPSELAAAYKAKLEAAVRGAVHPAHWDHPFSSYTLHIPSSLRASAQRIGELFYTTAAGAEASWVDAVVEDLQARYGALDGLQQAAVDPRLVEPLFAVEPFVDATMSVLTGGASDLPTAHKLFRTTDNRRWSIGFAHFLVDGEPYRLNVQYSLFFGAVTSIGAGSGLSRVDAVINEQNEFLRTQAGDVSPYYTADLMNTTLPGNFLGLGGRGLEVMAYDRRLETVDVTVTVPVFDAQGQAVLQSHELTAPGKVASDRAGYSRQLRGERWEFVPADRVVLYGKETLLIAYVRADGVIGRIEMPTFKGSVQLCEGLSVRYGDDLRDRISAWAADMPLSTYQSCDIVFNYSDNGNVLDSVASLSGRVSLTTVGGRAVTVSMWL